MSVQDWHSHAAEIQPLQPAQGHRAQVTLPTDPAPEQTLEIAGRLAADLSAELAADLAALTRVLLGVDVAPAAETAAVRPVPSYESATVPPIAPIAPSPVPAVVPVPAEVVEVPAAPTTARPTAVLDSLAFLDL